MGLAQGPNSDCEQSLDLNHAIKALPTILHHLCTLFLCFGMTAHLSTLAVFNNIGLEELQWPK